MNQLLLIALEAAIKAGDEIMAVYSRDFEVEYKEDHSPLTIADANANKTIHSFLEKTGIPIISEESKQADYNTRRHWRTCWLVDPLDGTKEFIKRNGEFTVNIALIENQKPILGVIYVPVSKTLYYGEVSNKTAFKIELPEAIFGEAIFHKKVELIPQKSKTDIITIVGSRSHKSNETSAYIKSLEEKGKHIDVVNRGSSLKFCLLAEGKATVYPRFAPTMEWDTAAGHAICNAVGLKVKYVDKNEELQYNKEDLLNPYFIVQYYGAH